MGDTLVDIAAPAAAPPAAVEEAPTFQLGRVVTISAGHFMHDIFTAFLAPVLPILVERLAMTTAQAGALQFFIRWPSLLQPVIGGVADRVGARWFFILAPAATAVGMSLMGFMPTYAALAILMTVVGFSSACLHATGPVMIGRVSGAKIGRGSGWWMFGGELGRTVGPLIIVAAVSALTLRGAAVLMVPGIAASALLFFQLRNLPAAHHKNTAAPLDLRATVRLLAPVMLPVSGLVLLPAFVTQALATFLPLFFSREGASLWMGGSALTLWQAAGVVGALAGGTLSDRFGRRLVVAAVLVSSPLLMLAFILASGWVRFALLVPLGFATLAITPVLLAVVLESFPHNRALANGVYMAISFLSGAGAAIAVGAFSDAFGMHTAYTISALIMLAALPLVLLLPRRAQR